MFIENALIVGNKPSKYLLGILIFVALFFIGQAPITLYVFHLVTSKGISMPTTEKEIFAIMDSNLALFLMLMSFFLVFIFFPLVLKKLHAQSIKNILTARQKFDFSRFLFSFLLWGSIAISSTLIEYIISPNDFVLQFQLNHFLTLLAIAVIFLTIQSATEEMLFRGYLMQGIGFTFKNKLVPLLFTAVLFGVMHGANPEVDKFGYLSMVYYIGTGIFLGIITLMDDGLELALGFHISNNVLSSLIVTADWSALQTHAILKDISEPAAEFQILFPVFVVYPILLIIFAYMYQWKDWINKLTGKIVINQNNGNSEYTNVS